MSTNTDTGNNTKTSRHVSIPFVNQKLKKYLDTDTKRSNIKSDKLTPNQVKYVNSTSPMDIEPNDMLKIEHSIVTDEKKSKSTPKSISKLTSMVSFKMKSSFEIKLPTHDSPQVIDFQYKKRNYHVTIDVTGVKIPKSHVNYFRNEYSLNSFYNQYRNDLLVRVGISDSMSLYLFCLPNSFNTTHLMTENKHQLRILANNLMMENICPVNNEWNDLVVPSVNLKKKEDLDYLVGMGLKPNTISKSDGIVSSITHQTSLIIKSHTLENTKNTNTLFLPNLTVNRPFLLWLYKQTEPVTDNSYLNNITTVWYITHSNLMKTQQCKKNENYYD